MRQHKPFHLGGLLQRIFNDVYLCFAEQKAIFHTLFIHQIKQKYKHVWEEKLMRFFFCVSKICLACLDIFNIS